MLKVLKKIGAAFLLLFLLGLVLELALGVVFWMKDKNNAVEDVTDAPYLYYQFNEGEQTNQHGFKTTASISKPEGVYRIILTGGSVARGKAPNESIAQYLQDSLRTKLGNNNIEVINAGVSGYVLQQEFILTQMILLQYQPDMIIGLDGYNDALTLALNPDWANTTPFKPHNWQQFQVIKEGRWEAKPYSRFSYFFKNVNRAKESYLRNKQQAMVDWSAIINSKAVDTLAQSYQQIYTDIHDFCDAKGIIYYHFIQPVNTERVVEKFDNGAGVFMLSFMNKLQNQTDTLHYVHSLQRLFGGQEQLFYDDVHVVAEGNQKFAGAIANALVTSADSILTR